MHVNGRKSGLRIAALAVATLTAVPIVAMSSTASAAPGGDRGPDRATPAAGVPAEVLAAMQRDLGLTAEQAARRVTQQAAAVSADRKAQATLGSEYAGSWFDAGTGKLVVASTSSRLAAKVAASNVQTRTVKNSKARLDGIKARLDSLAGPAKNDPRVRETGGARSPALAGLVGWHVDQKANKVVVTTQTGRDMSGQAKQLLAQYGDDVRVEQIDNAPTFTADYLDGGDWINTGNDKMHCSAGFNLRSEATGTQYLLTAGHCVTNPPNNPAVSAFYGQGKVYFGPVLEGFFPYYDDALVRNDNTGYWLQGPWVDVAPSNGDYLTISGYTDAPVGTAICKSGVKTGLTCGTIQAKDETVTYDDTYTVVGLTRHDACVEKGDSGGANFATTSGYPAEGVTSGASLYKLQCGEKAGYANVSWYFPIADSLSYYGPRYQLTLW